MSNFPPAGMASKEDTAFFSHSMKDDVERSETAGGYDYSRPRPTRPPTRLFETGFTDISDSDKALLEQFYEGNRASIFTWTDWTNGVEYQVRFAEPLTFTYTGMGPTRRWNTQAIKLRQV